MKNEEIIEIFGAAEIANDVERRVKTTGVRGLDFEAAKKLGVFTRIGNLLTVMHSVIMAAYRVYGGVDYLVDQMFARKNEIAREMNAFEKAFDRFIKFWTNYYIASNSYREAAYEVEHLYMQIMRWMQIPETWQLGDPQHTDDSTDLSIKIDSNSKTFTFRKADIAQEVLKSEESWCVLQYDPKTNKQTSIHLDMDKSSALMVAKRLSCENKDCVYTAAIIRDVTERRTEVIPFKAFENNTTVGKVTKVLKKEQD